MCHNVFGDFEVRMTKTHQMKSRPLFILALAAIAISSCFPDRRLHRILDNQEKRGKVYHQILQNQIYAAQLLDSLWDMGKVNEAMLYATTIKESTNTLMALMLHEIEADSLTCRMMCLKIMENQKALTMMMEMMNEKRVVGHGLHERGCPKETVGY